MSMWFGPQATAANFDETVGVVAHNTVHHAEGAVSYLELPVLDDTGAKDANP